MKTYIGIVLLFMFSQSLFAQDFEYYNGVPVEAKKIIIKYKPQLKSFDTANDIGIPSFSKDYLYFQSILSSLSAGKPEQKFPISYMPDSCEKCVDISLIYEFTYSADIDITYVLAMLRGLSILEYAEPNFVEDLLFVPNDPIISQQWHMNTCKIYEAWDIEQGDSTVVIGITDSGFEISHLDLINQIKYNYNDPINGQDSDFDGYIDNFRGWDFGNNDNNPDAAQSDHGTWVAGVSNAEVNNEFAIAGVGYNTKFLPIKVATDQGFITRGYEGIVYAANQNCQIINCSWGSVGSYSRFSQDIINYATFNRNSLVIAAAGNNNNTSIFYPASYQYVFSVGGSDVGDEKWTGTTTGSNWNYYVDVVAPARGYRTLHRNNSTTSVGGGTSFATPIVSGIAALVKSKYLDISPLELAERIRVTSDDIYQISSNQQYLHLLGNGRVNALRALTDSTTPSVRIWNYEAKNRNGSYMFFPGDTLELTLELKNYLADATNIFISVSCENSFIAPIKGTELFSEFLYNETKIITLSFKIVQTLPPDIQTFFKATYSGNNYFSFEYFPLSFNPSYYDFSIGNFNATATANGTVGVLTPNRRVEHGIVFKDFPSLLYEGSLLISKPNEPPAAYVREHKRFTIKDFPEPILSDSVDILIRSSYTAHQLGIDVEQFIYGWEHTNALIHEYRISQSTDSVYHNIHIGPYIDWAIMSQTYNKIAYIDSLQFGYAYSLDPWGFYAGILPLHYHKTNFYAVDDGVGLDTVYIANGFSDGEIRFALTHNKYAAGLSPDGGLVSSVSGAYIPELRPDSIHIVRFAILAGESFHEILETASQLAQKYIRDTTSSTPTSASVIRAKQEIEIKQKKSALIVSYPVGNAPISIRLFSIIGTQIIDITLLPHEQTGTVSFPIHNLQQGLYVVHVKQGITQEIEKIHVRNGK